MKVRTSYYSKITATAFNFSLAIIDGTLFLQVATLSTVKQFVICIELKQLWVHCGPSEKTLPAHNHWNKWRN